MLKRMKNWFFLSVLAMLCPIKSRASDTCMDLRKSLNSAKDGSHVFQPSGSNIREYVIFCDHELGHGYTFISAASFASINVSLHNVDTSDVKMVFLAKNGTQYEAILSPIDESQVIDIEYTHGGEYPYSSITFSVGLRDRPMRDIPNPIGYMANGVKVLPKDCKIHLFYPELMKTIWTLLPNKNDVPLAYDNRHRSKPPYLKEWTTLSEPASISLPRNFFSLFETSVSICYGYVGSEDFPDIIGAAVGLKYVMTCQRPEGIKNGHYVSTGNQFNDTVTYYCDEGFALLNGEGTGSTICNERGVWVGELPSCNSPRSCSDIAVQYGATLPGEYVIYYSGDNTPVRVYCEFNGTLATSFIPSEEYFAFFSIIHDIYVTEIVIRTRYQDGRQVESVLRQLDKNKDSPIQVDFQLDFIMRIIFITDVLSYNVNGQDVETVSGSNCCFTIWLYSNSSPPDLFNERLPDVDVLDYPVAHKWLTEAVHLDGERYMPTSYFNIFRVTAEQIIPFMSYNNVTGMAIGLRSNI